ncbi:MAG TPA: type II secretion system inner membrane protein GspF [Polaromonas sp.]|uniref:type II secretion system inner membrane protein GspF n=1 Tax=Polaromonas sp. TaxID=1869339 RepID=UPI002D525DE7|nr:type II secretion system inner membrane protein GspF [Polaromonas sp.]HYW58397.1 type II secretion system inner membrane protein GspF [Polaromonas sp.]
MPSYFFEALTVEGQLRKGVVESDTVRTARSLLRSQTLIPLRVEPVSPGTSGATQSPQSGLRSRMFSGRAFNATTLAIWTRQLAGLVSSGLPLERALTALADESENEGQRQLLAALRADVNEGTSFAGALSRHAGEFSPIYVSAIGAGEETGKLGLVLLRLADDLEERQTLKSKLVGAALYPAIVTVVALVIVAFLMAYVVPQVATVFTSSKRALPFVTLAMLAVSNFVRNWGLVALIVSALAMMGLSLSLRKPAFRTRFDAAWLKLPLVGRLSRNYNAARFAGTLAMLTGAGVPILKSLQAAAQTLSNHAMRADALEVLTQVREGTPLGLALGRVKRFPGLLGMFARLGEQTGQLPAMLQRAATQLSTEVQRRALYLTTILEPLLIVLMGGVVMLIVLAVLLPIIQLNQFAR